MFDTFFKDPSGKLYVPGDVGARVAARANAPVYTLYQTGVGKGAVGGVVVNFVTIGKQGAKMVLGLLAGAPISKYPVERFRHGCHGRLEKVSAVRVLPKATCPLPATVLFRPPTLWEKYRSYLIAGGVVILLQTILIIELALAGKLRKKSERSARVLARRLINAQEEERRRLAGELHDDVSQRLALVAIHLDTMRSRLPPCAMI